MLSYNLFPPLVNKINGKVSKLQLANNIYALRIAYGETQEELAHILGLEGKTAVSNWENAEKVPSRDTILAIAKRYNATAESIMNADYSDLSGDYHE